MRTSSSTPASDGRLEDGEVFAAWRHAKREGCIPDDDPIPHRPLQYVAREHGLMEDGDLMDGWKLPREAYNAALATVRDEYGVDPGRGDISAGEREHTAVLPAAVRDLTTASSGWDWKHAGSDDDTLTVEDARERTVDAIADKHGERPSVITTTTAEHEYDADGVLEHVAETKHYGNVLGSNEFDDTRLGAVIGSNHYGDHYIKKWGAYAGEAVDRGEEKGADLSYSGFGDDVLQHMREHDTLQAAMRFGRDGNGAVVYVHTDTLPEWVPIAGEGRVLTTWSDGMWAVVDALEDLTTATTADVVAHPAVDLSQQQVFDHLENLRERGVLQRQQDTEDGRRVVWRDDRLHRLGEHGEVELEPVDLEELDDDEVRQLARSSIYTWEFTNLTAEDAGSTGDTSLATADPARVPANGSDRPPDDAD